jgi:protein phosphatase
MKCAYASDVGVKRKNNQDAYLAANITKEGKTYYLFAVAAGLGGHQSGEVASQMAIDYIKKHFYYMDDFFDYEAVDEFVNKINMAIIEKGCEIPEYMGMATTLTMAVVTGDHMGIYHVGDSRAYRVSEGDIEQLTKDHSLVQTLVDQGRITPEEAKVHPQKNVITRALGTDERVRTAFYEYTVFPEDQILLCSDGLSNMVEDDEIRDIVSEDGDIERIVDSLISRANYYGGNDNISVVVVSV